MSEALSFSDLILRVRSGDQAAAAELVRQYEPAVRRAVRFRLVDTRLERVFDSMDICQAVWASFFVRAASGQYNLDQPESLLKLLVTMARNKLASEARKQQAERRDNRRVQALSSRTFVAPGPSPSQHVATQELLQEVQRRLSAEERQLVDLRNQGLDWAAIARQLGSTPIVLRKKLSRALDRVTQQLGLEENDE